MYSALQSANEKQPGNNRDTQKTNRQIRLPAPRRAAAIFYPGIIDNLFLSG